MESDPARSALAAFRDATRCAPELRADNLRAIEARIHGAVPRRRASTIGRVTVIVAALAAAAIAVWLAGDLSDEAVAVRDAGRDQAIDAAPHDDAPQRAAERVARPPVVIPEPPSTPTVIAAPDASAPTPVQRPPRAAERDPAPDEPAAAAPASEALAREVALMAELQREVNARQPLAARRALDALAREFPDGALVEERWALEVLMHCYDDEPDAAAMAAAAFRRARPHSSLAQQLAEHPCPAKSR